MLFTLLLVMSGSDFNQRCSLPVAADEKAARRIAEAVIQNVPASALARAAQAAGEPYELTVEPDREDVEKWIAFQSPQRKKEAGREGEIVLFFAGHGLGFRIDRCTGAISRLYYQR